MLPAVSDRTNRLAESRDEESGRVRCARFSHLAENSPSRAAQPPTTGRRLHELAIELAAMSQNGLHYATDRYDIARYERMRQIAAEVLSMIAAAETGAGPSAEDFHRSLLDEEARHAESRRAGGVVRPR